MTNRLATCSCGRLRVTTDGDPVRISVCHCLECQRRTGSAFGVQARFPEDRVRMSGESVSYIRSSDSGNAVHFHFCANCGSTLWYTLEQAPGFIAIPVGMFADPAFPAPTLSIYEARRHPWLEITTPVEHLD